MIASNVDLATALRALRELGAVRVEWDQLTLPNLLDPYVTTIAKAIEVAETGEEQHANGDFVPFDVDEYGCISIAEDADRRHVACVRWADGSSFHRERA